MLLYGTLALARPIGDWLRARNLLRVTTAAIVVASAAMSLRFLLRRGADETPVPRVAIAATALAGVWLLRGFELPVERVHVGSYLVVGVLAWRAFGGALLPAAATTLAIGIGDETIQALLPSRVFDVWDIVGNAVAGLAALLLAAGGRLSWGAPLVLLVGSALFTLRTPMFRPRPTPAAQSKPPPPAAASLAGVDAAAAYAGRSVVFVSVDALRADNVPPWGRAPVPMPAFERLARESIHFEHAAAVSIWTTPALVSFLSALHPEVHGVAARGLELAPSVRTPLDTLRAAGWRTLGFAGDASETYRHLGFEAELDRRRPPADVISEALGAARAARRPVFLWMHLREIHAPYDATPERLRSLGLPAELPESKLLERARTQATVPRAEHPGRHAELIAPVRALYAAEVAAADEALGRILAALDAGGFAREVLLVVSADHGEELLEHGGIGHASTTLDSAPQPELVWIPLYLRLPDGRGAGRRVDGRIEQVDLLPTLLPLLGLRVEDPAPGVASDGRDLSAYLPGGRAAGQPIPERPLLVSGSPCGWQCPPERAHERRHAWVEGDVWTQCREPEEPCPEPLAGRLAEARARGAELATPVPSPPDAQATGEPAPSGESPRGRSDAK